MDLNAVIEISQVANGFIVRRSPGNWMATDENTRIWAGTVADYYVFQTFRELSVFVSEHFTYRQKSVFGDTDPVAG